jgi:hypothetical protein
MLAIGDVASIEGARMANVTEGEIIRRLVAASAVAKEDPEPADQGVAICADYEGHRVRAGPRSNRQDLWMRSL